MYNLQKVEKCTPSDSIRAAFHKIRVALGWNTKYASLLDKSKNTTEILSNLVAKVQDTC